MSFSRLLKQTRDSVEVLADSYYFNTPWRTLVENCQDHELLHVTRECTKEELIQLAYFGIALNRHRFINWWWNRKALPQLGPSEILQVVVALEHFKTNNINPTNMLIVIIRSKTLRRLYPQMLLTNSMTELRELLIEFATRYPNGMQLLWKEWKQYSYSPKVWCFEIEYYHSIDHDSPQTLHVTYRNTKRSISTTPLLQLCGWGNKKDLQTAVRIPVLWENVPSSLLACIAKNTNRLVYNYFMELIWSVKKVCDQLPSELGAIIWNNCYLKGLVVPDTVSLALACLNNKRHRDWCTRLRLLIRVCPEICSAALITKTIPRNLIHQACPRLYNCTYYHFVPARPVHAKPEEVLWVEKQQPLLTPKADGEYFRGLLAENCHPLHGLRYTIQAEEIYMNNMTLFIVFDVQYGGRWDERVAHYARQHKYWRGPYSNINDENADLSSFLKVATEHGWKKVWWPKGIYSGITGEEYFHMLSTAPETIYPNDGWVITGNKGLLLKVKPQHQLTLDVLYTENSWRVEGLIGRYDQVIDEFPNQSPIPKKIPVRALGTFIRQFLQEMETAAEKDKFQLLRNCCELIALNISNIEALQPELVVGIYEHICLISDSEFQNRYDWLLASPYKMPNNWHSEYNGARINDGVWRCVWDLEQGMWKPHSRRYDKSRANTHSLAIFLTTQHQYPWNPIQLIPFHNHRPYYHIKIPKHRAIHALHAKQRKDVSAFRTEQRIESYKYGNLASGYQIGYKWGIDLDPYIVAEQNWTCNDNSLKWCEGSSLCNPVTGEKYEFPLTHIAVQKAIHYVAENKDKWLSFIDLISNSRFLYITMIDADILFKESNIYTMPDGSTMEKGVQSWHRGIWNGVSHLKWNGGEAHHEPFVSYSFVHQELIAAGWRNIGNTRSELGLRLLHYTKKF